MITAGIDLGCEWSKVVVVRDGEIVSSSIIPYGSRRVSDIARQGFREATEKAGITDDDVEYIVAVGSYREAASFAHDVAIDSTCCARGATLLAPTTQTVLDIGADKCLAVRCAGGRPLRTGRNERCASGSGRYLAIVSKLLGVEVGETEQLALKSTADLDIESTCAVFAESEVISLLHQKRSKEDIAKAALRGLARRIYPLLTGVNWQNDVTVLGGLARNRAVVKAVEEQIGCEVRVPEEPAIGAALGAAIVAAERRKALS